MSFNQVIIQGIIKETPILYSYNDKEYMELLVITYGAKYKKDNKDKKIVEKHKVIISNEYYLERAKKDNIAKDCHILIKGKLCNMIDSTGLIPFSYCIGVIGNHHYLKVISNIVFQKEKLKEYQVIKDFLNDV